MFEFIAALDDMDFHPAGKTIRQLYEVYTGAITHKEAGSILPQLLKLSKKEQDRAQLVKPLDKGKIMVERNEEPLLLYPGEYLLLGTEVQYYSCATWHDKNFFYIFKQRYRSYPNSHLGRFYFNLSQKGAVQCMKALSQIKDHYFTAKCFYDAKFYHRKDIVILCFPLEDMSFFKIWAEDFYDLHSSLFRKGLPYFLKPLRPAVGFGENPESDRDSFGSQRVRIVKEFLDRGGSLNSFLKKKGYDPKALYMNPGSPFSALYQGW